jgi:hypothetical protein
MCTVALRGWWCCCAVGSCGAWDLACADEGEYAPINDSLQQLGRGTWVGRGPLAGTGSLGRAAHLASDLALATEGSTKPRCVNSECALRLSDSPRCRLCLSLVKKPMAKLRAEDGAIPTLRWDTLPLATRLNMIFRN